MNKLAFALCATLLLAPPAFAQSTDQGPPPPTGATPTDAGPPPADQGAPPPADQGGPPPADQGAPPPADKGGPAPADEGGGGKGGGNKMKDIMQACRTQAKSQGLKGHDLRQAVMDCAVKQRPQAADRLKCRMAGRDKGLKKDELKTFVQNCMKGGKG